VSEKPENSPAGAESTGAELMDPPVGADSAPSALDGSSEGDLPQDDIDALLKTVEQGATEPATAVLPESAGTDSTDSGASPGADEAPSRPIEGAPVRPLGFDLPEFGSAVPAGVDVRKVSLLHDVNLKVKIELGRTWMLVEDVLKLGEGSVVELDKAAGDPVDVFVNDRLIARGEVLVLNDSFCVRINEVLSHDPHRVSG
jgi:flagellar motor switch protein FliN